MSDNNINYTVGDAMHDTASGFINDGIDAVANLFNPWSDGRPPGDANYDESGNTTGYSEDRGGYIQNYDSQGNETDKYYRE